MIQKKRMLIILLLLLPLQIVKAQENEFTVGVWTSLAPDSEWVYPDPPSSTEVESLGVNLVLHPAKQQFQSYLQSFDKVIALNGFERKDLIHKYSGGYYSRWECEEDHTGEDIPGIKHGGKGTDMGSAWFCDPSYADKGDLVVTGPDYDQDKHYRFYFNKDTIFYHVNYRMKIGQPTEEHKPVCEISVKYVTMDNKDTVVARDTLYSDELSTSYQDFSLEYFIPDTIDGKYYPMPAPISPGASGTVIENGALKGVSPYGVQFNVTYLGNEGIYIDYIEVYDNEIWKNYLDYPSTTAELIDIYADSVLNTLSGLNLEYWYSLDEPKTIDNYEPYRIVDSILQYHSHQPLITTYYPEWDGKRNNKPSMKRFVDAVSPEQIMFYYYPFWYDKINAQGLRKLKRINHLSSVDASLLPSRY